MPELPEVETTKNAILPFKGKTLQRIIVNNPALRWPIDEKLINKIKDVKIIRIEQIYPFPFDRLSEILMKYKDCEMIWAQEEPKNMGTWGFVKSRIRHVFVQNNYEKKIHYVGRRPAAAPATGISKRHITNQMLIKELALKSSLKRVIKERSGVSFMKFKNLPKE